MKRGKRRSVRKGKRGCVCAHGKKGRYTTVIHRIRSAPYKRRYSPPPTKALKINYRHHPIKVRRLRKLERGRRLLR